MVNRNSTAVRIKDRNSFNEFCSETYPSLLAYAKVFLTDEWAQDVVQDVFYSVWEKRDILDENGIRPYIFRSVHNRCLNYIRNQSRSGGFREWNEAEMAEIAVVAGDYEKNPVLKKLYDGDLRENLREAIESLSPRCREVFCLSYIEDHTTKEISEKLGISTSTVENHIHLALKQLRSRLNLNDLYSIAVFAIILKKIL